MEFDELIIITVELSGNILFVLSHLSKRKDYSLLGQVPLVAP